MPIPAASPSINTILQRDIMMTDDEKEEAEKKHGRIADRVEDKVRHDDETLEEKKDSKASD